MRQRLAVWIDDRLPRVDAAADRVDWFQVWLVVGLLLAAAIATTLYLVDHVFHTAFLPSSVPPQRSLKGYAAAHAFVELQVVGLAAAAYPLAVWMLVRLFASGRGLGDRR